MSRCLYIHDCVEVRRIRSKGRGVFARFPLYKGEVIADCPVLVGTHAEMNGGLLVRYTFDWDGKSALALGIGSLLNHSYSPNAVYKMLYRQQIVRITAYQDISTGEEIVINYNFDPKDKTPVGFPVKP